MRLPLSMGCAFGALLLSTGPAFAQAQPAAPRAVAPPPSAQPVPAELELAKLIWLTMAAIDQANQSGNYSVLRDISAPGFQISNDPTRLAQVFAALRAQRIDLGNTLLLAPTYTAAPQLTGPDMFRVQGYFGLRPTAIAFDLQFQWSQGKWRLFGVSISPRSIAGQQPEGTAPSQPVRPAPQQPRR